MKSLRSAAFSALLTIGAFSAITYTACNSDKCKDVVCAHSGVCSDGVCSCPVGYEGSNCQTLSRDKFIGTYVGSEACTIGTDSYSVTVATNSDSLKLTLSNIYNQSYTGIGAMVATDSFYFNGNQSGATFSGTGKMIANNQLRLIYSITDGVNNNSCTFTGSK